MSTTIKVTLTDPAYSQLLQLAENTGQPPATLGAQMIRRCTAQALADGKPPTTPPAATGEHHSGGQHPSWLEPDSKTDQWRAELWARVLALHARYPQELSHLKDGWWQRQTHVEILAALAAWRAELDQHAEDPREELTFHAQLADYAHTLRQEGGSLGNAWAPGPAPPEWAGGQAAQSNGGSDIHSPKAARRL